MLTLKDILTGFYSYGNKSNIFAFIYYLSFSYSPWFSWTSNLNYIVHWTICQYLGFFTLSWMCSTCLLLLLDLLIFHITPHIYRCVPSMFHVNYCCTASPAQKVRMLGWLLGNPNPCYFLLKYSLYVVHVIQLLIWGFPNILIYI